MGKRYRNNPNNAAKRQPKQAAEVPRPTRPYLHCDVLEHDNLFVFDLWSSAVVVLPAPNCETRLDVEEVSIVLSEDTSQAYWEKDGRLIGKEGNYLRIEQDGEMIVFPMEQLPLLIRGLQELQARLEQPQFLITGQVPRSTDYLRVVIDQYFHLKDRNQILEAFRRAWLPKADTTPELQPYLTGGGE